MATAQGQFSFVTGPAIVKAGAGLVISVCPPLPLTERVAFWAVPSEQSSERFKDDPGRAPKHPTKVGTFAAT
jgi:hypothetical protein